MTTNLNPNFSHRTEHFSGKVNALSLADTVSSMTNQAVAILDLMQYQFEEPDGARVTDHTLHGVLQSVIYTLKDIDALVQAYHTIDRERALNAPHQPG